MAKTSLHAFKAKDTRFVADWLKKLCSVFEGIQEPVTLSLACKSVVSWSKNHVYIHSFRSIIKATEKFPGGGGIWSPGMDLWWGIWTAFRPREGEFEQKFSKNSNARGVARGGGGCWSFDLTGTLRTKHVQNNQFKLKSTWRYWFTKIEKHQRDYNTA